MFSPACICVCSAEDPRVGGDPRRPAGVQLLPAGAERRDRRQGQRKDDHLLATGRERQPMTEHFGQEGGGGRGGNRESEADEGSESPQTNCKNERRREWGRGGWRRWSESWEPGLRVDTWRPGTSKTDSLGSCSRAPVRLLQRKSKLESVWRWLDAPPQRFKFSREFFLCASLLRERIHSITAVCQIVTKSNPRDSHPDF